jgi:DMSO/TMAO reductase YedYZ molybdopterin-dependent catalytic subunit
MKKLEQKPLPPGQYTVRDFPVLHVGSVPAFDPKTWRFRMFGEIDNPAELTWQQFMALPAKTVKTDIHCVTRWTKFDTTWRGVPFAEIARLASPRDGVRFVLTHAATGYTANLPLAAALDDDVLFAYQYEGEPLEPIHGGPLRMFVPKRYFWKSTKWCNGVEFLRDDKQGFWETRGYNNDADPWKEQRYW